MCSISVIPLTADRWPDLVVLFATSAVTRGCWCIWPRTPRERFLFGDANEARLRAIARAGIVPGLIAYIDGLPAGWCSLGPRSHYVRFFDEHNDPDTWLIACLFIQASHRGRRVGSALLDAAVTYAADRGAHTIEGLPRGWRPDDDPTTADAVLRLFYHAGFTDQAQPPAVARVRKVLAQPTA